MAGTFPGVSNAQQHDLSGLPLAGAQLFVYIGGTQILAQTFQDIGLAIVAQNPLIADAGGRVPLFFVADGTYRLRLVDSSGAIDSGGFDYPQVPSIGASSGGGGGSAVDPTTVYNTGDLKLTLGAGIVAGYVRANGRTLGNAISGASELASPTAQALFVYIYNNFTDGECPVSGGRTGNALNDFNANKNIVIPDLRGCALFGNTQMGSGDNGALAGIAFTTRGAIAPYGKFGAALLLLNAGQVPPMPVALTTSVTTTVTTGVTTSVTTTVGTSTTTTVTTTLTDPQHKHNLKSQSNVAVNGAGITVPLFNTFGSAGAGTAPTGDTEFAPTGMSASSSASSTSVSSASSSASSVGSSSAVSTAVTNGTANPGSPNNPIDKTPPGCTTTIYIKL